MFSFFFSRFRFSFNPRQHRKIIKSTSKTNSSARFLFLQRLKKKTKPESLSFVRSTKTHRFNELSDDLPYSVNNVRALQRHILLHDGAIKHSFVTLSSMTIYGNNITSKFLDKQIFFANVRLRCRSSRFDVTTRWSNSDFELDWCLIRRILSVFQLLRNWRTVWWISMLRRANKT